METVSENKNQEFLAYLHSMVLFGHIVKHGVESGVEFGVESGVEFGVKFGVEFGVKFGVESGVNFGVKFKMNILKSHLRMELLFMSNLGL